MNWILLGGLLLPKYDSRKLNYGNLNDFKSSTIRPVERWSDPNFPKTNWPDGMKGGIFIIENFNGTIRQTAISEALCIRFYIASTDTWTEWKIY